MITYAQVQDKINLNLGDNSNIVPSEHREVEQILLDYIKENIPLHKGSLAIGNISTDQLFNITFPAIATAEYYVIGSLQSNSANFDADNDVMWVWREATTTGFKIALREVSNNIQNLTFYYEIKKI